MNILVTGGERFSGKAINDESCIDIGWSAKIDVIDYINTIIYKQYDL